MTGILPTGIRALCPALPTRGRTPDASAQRAPDAVVGSVALAGASVDAGRATGRPVAVRHRGGPRGPDPPREHALDGARAGPEPALTAVDRCRHTRDQRHRAGRVAAV